MKTSFKPAWWLKGPHLQTLWPSLLRRKNKLALRNERLELNDGDFLDLSWVGDNNGPIVLMLHGLNGGINSHYANGLMHAIQQRGWRGVVMHFRGCSGEPNRLARSYHSGETGDVKTVIAELIKREPHTPIFLIGYSLGGNVLLKMLGENKLPPSVKAAVAVSVPFELAKTADHLNKGFSKIYQWRLVRELVRMHFNKFNVKHGKLHTFWQFDNTVTAPLHGFASAMDYYTQSSSKQYLHQIQLPTLIIHAQNDPFTTQCALPTKDDVSKLVELEFTADGGHVGFVTGKYPWRPTYWLEQRILQYFAKY